MDKYICLTNTHTHTELIVSSHRFLDLFICLFAMFYLWPQVSPQCFPSQSLIANILKCLICYRCSAGVFPFFGFFPCTEFNLLILIAVKLGNTALSHQVFCIVPISSVNLVKLQSVFSCAPYQFFHYYILYTTSDWYSEYFDIPCRTWQMRRLDNKKFCELLSIT